MFPNKPTAALAALLMGLLVAIPASAGTPAQAGSRKAADFVVSIMNRAEAILDKDGTARTGGRPPALKELVRESFDVELISRFVIGQHWKRATRRQKAEFRRLFTDYMLTAYADRLGNYGPGNAEVTAVHPVNDTDTFVSVRLVDRTGSEIETNWRVREYDGEYRIIDVVIHGVSLILTKRREFASVIQHRGMDGLLKALRTRLSADRSTDPETSLAFLLLSQGLVQGNLVIK